MANRDKRRPGKADRRGSAHALYAAADDATLRAHEDAMMASCARFIDFDRIDVVPMNEYLFSAAEP